MIGFLVVVVLAIVAGIVGHFVLFRILEPIIQRTPGKLDDYFLKHWRSPARLIVLILVLLFALQYAEPPDNWFNLVAAVRHLLSLVLIGAIVWLIVRTTDVLQDYLANKLDVNVKDNLKARAIHTQFLVFRRIVTLIVIILAVGSMLMTFQHVRALGGSILASAGIVGLIIGIAAQKSLGNLLAGIQIAITQPIRLDDVVIVENERGKIEEITLTYVVVCTWDMRRMVLPINYFIEKPFQNWTRVAADSLGTVFLYTDYTIPVEAVRGELQRILQNSRDWDGKACALQVTDTTEQTVELRALMSASDVSKVWDLRCAVREELIRFIQQNYPQALPRTRAELYPRRSGGSSPPHAAKQHRPGA